MWQRDIVCSRENRPLLNIMPNACLWCRGLFKPAFSFKVDLILWHAWGSPSQSVSNPATAEKDQNCSSLGSTRGRDLGTPQWELYTGSFCFVFWGETSLCDPGLPRKCYDLHVLLGPATHCIYWIFITFETGGSVLLVGVTSHSQESEILINYFTAYFSTG